MLIRRSPIMVALAVGFPVLFAMGCSRNGQPERIEHVQTSFGVSGSANPGGDSAISKTAPGPEASAGGSGLSDTRGTAVTGAKAGVGTPQLGETGNVVPEDTTLPAGNSPK